MAATSSSSGSNHNALQAIDRTTTTPVLLRCFWRLNQHHSVAEFRQADKEIFPAQEVQIYTWPDATLREITELLKDAIPAIRDQHAHVSYNLIFIDRASFWQTKPVSAIEKPSIDPQTRSMFSLQTSPSAQRWR